MLRDVRELKMIAAGAPLAAHSEAVRAEFTTRVRSAMAEDHQARWTPFATIAH
ncbi:hypothetical protein ACFOX0_03490 [Micromonospora zhanjiangensis]|uniref:Uncharacterized protein n=1 Tax=Micromonospora zhanjiangensis TaxID=1522057 RepID=A0ABV8KG43_9ACTN